MKIELTSPNSSLESIFSEPSQLITLDANLLIPPDRSLFGVRALPFKFFHEVWLEPVFTAFPRLPEEVISSSQPQELPYTFLQMLFDS